MAEPTKHPSRAAEPSRPEEAITEQGRLGGPRLKTEALLGGAETEPLVYRPLSIWAVAAFAMALVYAVLVVVGAIAGLAFGSPLLLGSWGFVLPVISAGLALVGRLLIARAEGTQAGLKLALWGWWLSILFGLGYGAFYAATYFAVLQQGDHFAQLWFDKLTQGKINAAYLQTLEPSVAQNVNPEDEQLMDLRFNTMREMGTPGQLTQFRESQLVRLIQQGGAETKIEAQGVQHWEYRSGGYRVRRSYLIRTPEGDYEFGVMLSGGESRNREWQGRRWQVVWGESGMQKSTPKPLATQVDALRQSGRQFVALWIQQLIDADLDAAFLVTLDSAERDSLLRRYQEMRLVLPSLAAGAEPMRLGAGPTLALLAPLIESEVGRELYLPAGYAKFKEFALLDDRDYRADDDRTRTDVQEGIRNFFRGFRDRRRANMFLAAEIGVNPTDSLARPYVLQNDRITFAHNCKLGFYRRYGCDTVVVIESGPGVMDPQAKPAWRVVRLELKRAEDVTKVQRPPGAPPDAPSMSGSLPVGNPLAPR